MKYSIEVAGISHKNKDGESRREIVIDNLYPDHSGFTVTLKRHSGNRSDKNAVGVYIEKSGFLGVDPVMIGFLPREVARDVSPMMKLGHSVDDIRITRVWVPSYSDTASPVVVISFDGKWTSNDLRSYKKEVSEERKLSRERNKLAKLDQLAEIQRKKSSPGLISRLLSFFIPSQNK